MPPVTEASAPNKANLPRTAETGWASADKANRTKQSQFPAFGPTRWTRNRQLRAQGGNPPPDAGRTPGGERHKICVGAPGGIRYNGAGR